jgi:Cu2+-containing amine oxidase
LTADEILRAATIVREYGGLSAKAWVETIALHEPTKTELKSGTSMRQAFVCCYDPACGETWNGQVDFANEELRNWRHVKGAQACENASNNDPKSRLA